MKTGILLLVVAMMFGCSKEPEQPKVSVEHKTIIVDVKPAPDAEVAGLSDKEAKEAQDNSTVAHREYGRIYGSLPDVRNPKVRLSAMSTLDAIYKEYESRTKGDGFLPASHWFRQQVEGKKAEDFSAK